MNAKATAQRGKDNTQVDVFIVGEPKSGTTALADFLDQHPSVSIARPKEPHYFATDLMRESDAFHGTPAEFTTRTPEDYTALFSHAKKSDLLGDASTGYLYSGEAAAHIYAHNPAAKIIIALREPVSFLQSLHRQYVNEASEDEPDFAAALAKETQRKKDQQLPKNVRTPSYLFYSERIKYAQHIQRFLDRFPWQQITVVLVEELHDAFPRILRFIGVDDTFQPDSINMHERKTPRFHRLNAYLRSTSLKHYARRALGEQAYTTLQKNVAERILLRKQSRPPLPEPLRSALMREYKPEVEAVSKLIGRDLVTKWGYHTL